MKALIIYNPNSGNQKVIKSIQKIKKKLALKYEIVDEYKSSKEISIVYKIKSDGSDYDLLVICGGDGTLNEAINGLMFLNKKPCLAYVPSGTVNDVGKMLGLNKRKLDETLDVILTGKAVKMDVCKIEDKYFVYAMAIGKYTNISYKASQKLKKKLGKIAYFIEALKHLGDDNLMNLTVTSNNKEIKGEYYVALGLNSQRVAGFLFHRDKKVKLNDGIIDLTLINKRTFSLLNLLMFFLLGDRWKNGVQTINSKQITINSLEKLSYNIDGEHAFDSKYATIEVIPRIITIVVSEKIRKKYFQKG